MSAICNLQSLAIDLGVTAESLDRLGVERDGRGWAIPERSADGEIIGHATRSDGGKKRCRPGSKRGLTLEWPLPNYAGTVADDPVLILEGMSDTAAGLDLKFTSVGRPNAHGGADHLAALLTDRHVVIIRENDTAGELGSASIAEALVPVAASVRIVAPPDGVKDLRQWRAAGLTALELLEAIQNVEPATAATPATAVGSDVVASVEPIELAEHLLARRFTDAQGRRTLRRWRGEFYQFNDAAYEPATDEALAATIYRHLEGLRTAVGTSVRVNAARVREVRLALPSRGIRLPDALEPPVYLAGKTSLDPLTVLAVANGLLNLKSGTLTPATPELFALNALPVEYREDAPEPDVWWRFLNELCRMIRRPSSRYSARSAIS